MQANLTSSLSPSMLDSDDEEGCVNTVIMKSKSICVLSRMYNVCRRYSGFSSQ